MVILLRDFFGKNAIDALNNWRGIGQSVTAVPQPKCPYCGCVPHQNVGQCPNVQKIEYYPDGTIKSVEKAR